MKYELIVVLDKCCAIVFLLLSNGDSTSLESGGAAVYGGSTCAINSNGAVIQCRCSKSIDGNYTLWFALAQCIQLSPHKPHTCQEGSKGIGEAFNSLVEPFFNHPLIKPMNCKPVEAAQLRQQWEQMVKDYEKRNALSDTVSLNDSIVLDGRSIASDASTSICTSRAMWAFS